MLTSDEDAAEAGVKDYYEASYVGMAKAYRDYLKEKGVLTDLTDVKDSIPLYIESFGCLEDIERILSIPVEVLKPLTTFDDLKDMYTRLSEEGVTNINFKLTGYANGGMNDTSTYRVKIEKKVGGKDGFIDFMSYATENGIGVYPDFDFANISMFEMFDGVTLRKHLVKTMDNRYTRRKELLHFLHLSVTVKVVYLSQRAVFRQHDTRNCGVLSFHRCKGDGNFLTDVVRQIICNATILVTADNHKIARGVIRLQNRTVNRTL